MGETGDLGLKVSVWGLGRGSRAEVGVSPHGEGLGFSGSRVGEVSARVRV